MANSPENTKTTTRSEPDYFVRFRLNQRIEHFVIMVAFIVLSVTGLAEKYYSAGWAVWVILKLGGIEYTRLVHRIFGLVLTLNMVYHFSYLVYVLFVRRARPTIMLSRKDVHDVLQMLRYGFGFGDKPPQFGRYDYRQKFEYWGVFLGGIIMVVTGFILVYPLAITGIFPGQLVAASREAHGSEATLAVIVIVVWHLYDTIFKPGIFPGDPSIFTGKISRKRMLEEHPLEYVELVEAKPDEAASTPASPAPPPPPE